MSPAWGTGADGGRAGGPGALGHSSALETRAGVKNGNGNEGGRGPLEGATEREGGGSGNGALEPPH